MGILSLLGSKDGAAFVVCNLIGFFVGYMLPHGTLAIIVSILVSYHLFLAWLLISADHKVGVALSIWSAILTHACCMAVVVSLPFARHAIPFFSLLRIGASFLAKFERDWLFRAEAKQPEPELKQILPVSAPIVTEYVSITGMLAAQENSSNAGTPVAAKPASTDTFASISNAENHAQMGEDEEAWLKYLRQPIRTFRKPGITLQEENKLWHSARAKSKAKAAAIS